jgi:hypothetical protein
MAPAHSPLSPPSRMQQRTHLPEGGNGAGNDAEAHVDRAKLNEQRAPSQIRRGAPRGKVVDQIGIKPTTSSLRTMRSIN